MEEKSINELLKDIYDSLTDGQKEKAKQFAETNHTSTEIKTQEEAEAERQC